MSKYIYFLSYSKLTNKIIEEYCLDSLVNHGNFIEYIDLTKLLRKSHIDNGMTTRLQNIEIKTYIQLIKYLKKNDNKNCIYFTNIPYQLRFFRFHLITTFFNLETWSIMNFGNPIYTVRRKFSEKFISHIKRPGRFIKILLNNSFIFLLSKFEFLNKYSICFCVGLAEYNNQHYTQRKVPLNSLDYDKAEALKKSIKLENSYKENIVFLDIFLPYHNDLEFSNEKKLNPKLYYSELNNFFSKIEKIYNKKVVVAAHPTAIYNINPFEGREIFWGKTSELVFGSYLVLSHWSTSINYAVIYKKPIIFFYTSDMYKYYKDSFMINLYSLSGALSQSLTATYDENFIDFSNKIDEEVYNKYIINYCSYNTNNLRNEDILLKQLS